MSQSTQPDFPRPVTGCDGTRTCWYAGVGIGLLDSIGCMQSAFRCGKVFCIYIASKGIYNSKFK